MVNWGPVEIMSLLLRNEAFWCLPHPHRSAEILPSSTKAAPKEWTLLHNRDIAPTTEPAPQVSPRAVSLSRLFGHRRDWKEVKQNRLDYASEIRKSVLNSPCSSGDDVTNLASVG